METQRRAVIVGGGIGGLTAAISLRQVGFDVAVYERAPSVERMQVGTGLSLWNNALRAFKELGLADQVAAAGGRITAFEIRSWDGRLMNEWPVLEFEQHFGVPSVGLSRAALIQVLIECLGDGVLHLGKECTGFTQANGHATVQFRDGSEESGDLLIGADGVNGIVRRQVLGDVNPTFAGYTVWQSVATIDPGIVRDGLFQVQWGQGTRFTIYPLGSNRFYWLSSANSEQGGKAGPRDKEMLLERHHGWAPPAEALLRATDASTIQCFDIFDRKPVDHWSDGRVTLLGDAAHPMTFNMGQGACQTVEDAVVLGKIFREESDVPEALKLYEKRRIPRTSTITVTSRRMGAMGRWRNPVACRVREGLVKMAYKTVARRQHEANMAYEF